MRAVQRDPFRSGRAPLRRTALHPGPLGELPALARDLEPRLHGVRPAPGWPGAAPVPEHRHRDEPGAPGERPPAGAQQLRHRPLRADPSRPRGDARSRPRARSRRSASATRSSPTTPGRSRSSSPTASCPRTRVVATSCAGSSAAPSGTDACWVAGSRSSPSWRRSSSRSWPGRTRSSPSTATRSSAAIDREEAQFARTLDAGSRLLDERIGSLLAGTTPAGSSRPPWRTHASSAGDPRLFLRMRGCLMVTSPSGSTTRTASRST